MSVLRAAEQQNVSLVDLHSSPTVRTSLRRPTLLFSAVLLVLPVGGLTSAAIYIAAALWALGGARRAIEALTISWLVTFVNPAIAGGASSAEALRWAVLAGAAGGVFGELALRRDSVPKIVIHLVAFSATAGMISIARSAFVDVSLFKLATFLLGSSTILTGFHLTRDLNEHWRAWLTALLITVVGCSLPLVFTSLGYLRNATGFQGVLNHPQAFAIFLAPAVAWLATRSVMRDAAVTRAERLLLWITPILLFLTQGRTGIAAIILAAVCAGAIGLLFRSDWRVQFARALMGYRRLLAISAGLCGLALGSEVLYERTLAFMMKGSTGTTVRESLAVSRGALLERSLANFANQPWFGVGFGMPSDPSRFEIVRDPYLGLPVSGAVEKGTMPVAVLEEVGIVGALIVVVMLVALLRPAARRRSVGPFMMAATAVTVNIGESVFFSVGGMGLMMWLYIGYGRIAE